MKDTKEGKIAKNENNNSFIDETTKEIATRNEGSNHNNFKRVSHEINQSHQHKKQKVSTNQDKISLCMTRKKITHVLFDMDGLLLDTERVYTEVTQNILNAYGKTFEWSLKAKMMGRKAPEAAQILVDELKIPLTVEDYLVLRAAGHKNLFPTCNLMPGVDKLVRYLHANNVPIGVATSSHSEPFSLKTQKHKDFFSLFDFIIKGDDPEVEKGKPSPDIFLIAASKWNPSPSSDSVLVFEDSPLGIKAAKAAGMQAILVPDPNLDTSSIKDADQIISSLENFDLQSWGLPHEEY